MGLIAASICVLFSFGMALLSGDIGIWRSLDTLSRKQETDWRILLNANRPVHWMMAGAYRKADICLLMPKFHYIYLAQNLLKTRSPTCRRQLRDQKSRGPGHRQDRSISTCRDRSSRSATCLRHVCDFFCRKQVLSQIEAVEFRNDKRTFRGSRPISSHLVMT